MAGTHAGLRRVAEKNGRRADSGACRQSRRCQGESVSDWAEGVEFLFRNARRRLRRVVRAIGGALGNDPFEILAYRGYGNPTRARVYGRALEMRNVSASTDSDSTFRNLLNTYRRADSDPLPFAQLKVEYADTFATITTDD